MESNNALPGQGVEPESKQLTEPKPEERPTTDLSTMETLLEEQGLVDLPKSGEVRSGIIAAIGENEIMVSVGTKSEGIISGRELDGIPAEERAEFTVGKEIPVYVVTPEDANGNVVLSYLRAREEKDWHNAEQFLKDTEAFDSKIIGYNKGGLLVPLGRLRGFVPASQISLVRRATVGGDSPDQRWGKMVGEPIKVRVIEVDRERHRLILSERAALQETRETLKDRLLDELTEGDVRTGRVTSVADFGAFVNIDGADGLVHLSEISWERINHPNEVLKVGQEVQVKVISVDHERRRIGLSIRQLQEDPWLKRIKGMREGQLVEGKITHLTKFGAFARLDEELEGLIHISELSEQRINHPKEVVKEGEVVTLRVIKIDPERRRIGLSRRKVDSPAYSDLDWKMALAEEVQEVQDTGVAKLAAEEEEKEASVSQETSEVKIQEAEPPVEASIDTQAEDLDEVQAKAIADAQAKAEAKALVEEETVEATAETQAEDLDESQAKAIAEAQAKVEADTSVESEAEVQADDEMSEAPVEAIAEAQAKAEAKTLEEEETVETTAEAQAEDLDEAQVKASAEAQDKAEAKTLEEEETVEATAEAQVKASAEAQDKAEADTSVESEAEVQADDEMSEAPVEAIAEAQANEETASKAD